MKIQKYILSLLIGSAAISFSSCNDFLDRDPLGQFTEEDLKTMDERVGLACEMIKSFCLAGIQITMNQFNKK